MFSKATMEAERAKDKESILLEAQKELEDLQVQTIFTLVEKMQVDVKGTPKEKHLLFLTNKQARVIDLSDIYKVLNALEVKKKPKLVISFLCSVTHQPGAGCFNHSHNEQVEGFGDFYAVGEQSEEDIRKMEGKILAYCRDCVLPLAIQTNAIVILHNDACVFSRCFSALIEAEEARSGELAFTPVNFGFAINYEGKLSEPGTNVNKIYSKSKRWKERRPDILEAMQYISPRAAQSGLELEEALVPHRLDAPACSHYIIVDCVTKGRKDLSALGTLKNNFVAQLAKKLPCIAVQTLSPLQWSRLEQVVDFACRGLPLLMLDTRPIPSGGYPRTLDAGEEYLATLDDELMEGGLPGAWNNFVCCTLAFLSKVMVNELESEGGTLCSKQGFASIHQLILESEQDADLENTSSTAKSNDKKRNRRSELALKAVQVLQRIENRRIEKMLVKESNKCELLRKEIAACPDSETLKEMVEVVSKQWVLQADLGHRERVHEMVAADPVFSLKEGRQKGRMWMYHLTTPRVLSEEQFVACKAKLDQHIAKWAANPTTYGC
ncbi:hypothetical protein TeGR_g1567 [Tetraparma gracilis]|uniref:Uncharacterized protein n=1 Tax=Tetraparma gracilis TaxID=2962635 RepID=A0ABQ6MBP7_9STRA|nr:hypothetical protein TeGR_g1567 [Tetraparma gracilis]